MYDRLLLTLALTIGIASSASAGVIGPGAASTLVNVTAFFSSCSSQGAKKFDGTTNASGQNLSFAIPAKKAFVATSITAIVDGLIEGEIAQVFANIEDSGGSSNGLIVLYTSPANAAGAATASLTLPTGIAGPRSDICVASFPGVLDTATMYGYFAPNK